MATKPAVWFTADTHFSHSRIVAMAKRPFRDAVEMDEALIRNWNDTVAPDDTVWHVGDFAVCADIARVEAIFSRLNGRKHLVVGNHDEENELVVLLPWESVSQMARASVGEETVLLCHYPMKTWPKARKGAIHAYGHMHGRLRGTSRSLDVGVDAWNYRPVGIDAVKKRLRHLPEDPDFVLDPDDGTGARA